MRDVGLRVSLRPDALNVARMDHAEFSHIEFGIGDLLRPRDIRSGLFGRTWDEALRLDTLLYRGDFVERVSQNIRTLVRPGGIVIIDVPRQFRLRLRVTSRGGATTGQSGRFCPAQQFGSLSKPAMSVSRPLISTGSRLRQRNVFLLNEGLPAWFRGPAPGCILCSK